jgi:hypothetical protein
MFPRNSFKAMKELIAGRITQTMEDEKGQAVQRSAAEVMCDVIFEGMLGNLVISESSEGSRTIANPLHAVKLYQD